MTALWKGLSVEPGTMAQDIDAALAEAMEQMLDLYAENTTDMEEEEDIAWVPLHLDHATLLRTMDFQFLRKGDPYSSSARLEYHEAQLPLALKNLLGEGECRLAFPLQTPGHTQEVYIRFSQEPPLAAGAAQLTTAPEED